LAQRPRNKFSSGVKAVSKVDNHAAAARAKAELRQNVLDSMDGPVEVFDAFAGSGEMWRRVWHKAAAYVGCDTTWYRDERLVFVADNRRVLRAIDLAPFNIFDLDAYGSPWEQAIIIAARRPVRPGERIGLVLTEGSGLKLKLGGYPAALRVLSGLRGKPVGGARGRHELTDRAISSLCRSMGTTVLRRWQAIGKTGAAVAYVGLVIEGLPAPPAPIKVKKKPPGPAPVEGAAEAAMSS
jgi:hypothetical protein